MSQDKSPIPENAQDSEAPEGKNRSQRDEARQSQTVSEQAQQKDRTAASDHDPSSDPGEVNPQDAQDLVDHMIQMERGNEDVAFEHPVGTALESCREAKRSQRVLHYHERSLCRKNRSR